MLIRQPKHGIVIMNSKENTEKTYFLTLNLLIRIVIYYFCILEDGLNII